MWTKLPMHYVRFFRHLHCDAQSPDIRLSTAQAGFMAARRVKTKSSNETCLNRHPKALCRHADSAAMSLETSHIFCYLAGN